VTNWVTTHPSCLSEEPIHDGCAGLDDGPDLVPVDQLGDVGSAVPDKPRNVFEGHPSVGQQRNERVPQLARRPIGRVEAGDQAEGAAQIATDIGGVHARARAGREHEAGLGPLLRRREPVLCLLHPLGAKGVDAQPGQGDGAA